MAEMYFNYDGGELLSQSLENLVELLLYHGKETGPYFQLVEDACGILDS